MALTFGSAAARLRPIDLLRGAADFRRAIESPAVWDSLAHRLPTLTTARTETVKFVVDRRDGDCVYFMNSKRWVLHEYFAMRFLDPSLDEDDFVHEMYRSPDRRYVLGSVMHYEEAGLWTVEIDASDTLPSEQIEWLVGLVATRLHVPRGEVCYRPRSAHQEQAARSFGDELRVVTGDEVNRAVTYQPLVTGSAVGYVRIMPGRVDLRSVGPRDIVVLDHVPDEIPPVAALVTGQFQAPLAHVAVLCRNRDTPDMSLRGATESDDLLRWADRLVRLDVDGQDFTVTPVDVADAERVWEAIRPEPATIPPADLELDDLVSVGELAAADTSFAGTKAVGLAAIAGLDGVAIPGGFVVPFAHYVRHLRSAGVVAPTDEAELAEARRRILDTPVDADLLDALERRLGADPDPQILRSSTNAEDLDGFNGAGLYESVPVADPVGREPIADALRAVWASVWSDRAFAEREWYRIRHADVAMAVLVQPLATPIDAIGVAVTHNPFNEGLPGMFINVQAADGSVTGAVGDELPEQFIVHTYSGESEVELVNRAAGRDEPLMDTDEVAELAAALGRIERAVVHPDRESTFADVEFALVPETGRARRRFLFLQARPYAVAPGERRSIWQDHDLVTRVGLFVRPRLFRAGRAVSATWRDLATRRR